MLDIKAKVALTATAASGACLQTAFALPFAGHLTVGLLGTALTTAATWLTLSGAGQVPEVETTAAQTQALAALAALVMLAAFVAAYQAQHNTPFSGVFTK